MSQAFWDRLNRRFNEYYDEAMKAKAELNRWYGVDNEKARRSVDGNGEMVGRMQFIVNFKKLQPGVTAEQWIAGELGRLANEKADAERDVASARTQIAIWKANRVAIDEESPRVKQMGIAPSSLGPATEDYPYLTKKGVKPVSTLREIPANQRRRFWAMRRSRAMSSFRGACWWHPSKSAMHFRH